MQTYLCIAQSGRMESRTPLQIIVDLPRKVSPQEAQHQRRDCGLDRIAEGFDASSFLAYHFPFFDLEMYKNQAFPDVYFTLNEKTPDGLIQATPLLNHLYVLNPERQEDRNIVYHQSTSACLLYPTEKAFLKPGWYFYRFNSGEQNFNLGSLFRSAYPPSYLVRGTAFVWTLAKSIRENAWVQAASEVFNKKNLTEILEAYDILGGLLADKQIDRSELELFWKATQRLGLSAFWQERLVGNDEFISMMSDSWQFGMGSHIRVRIEEMKEAAGNIPEHLLFLLNEPFPVLLIIDADAQESLPANPRFFIDFRQQAQAIYGDYGDQRYYRNPFYHTPFSLVEGKRIKAVVIPDKLIGGPRFATIAYQVAKLNPDCVIIGRSKLAKSQYAPQRQFNSCPQIYNKIGLTSVDVQQMIDKGVLVKLFADNVGVKEGSGVFAWSEVDWRKAREMADERLASLR